MIDLYIAYDMVFITEGKRAPSRASIRQGPVEDGMIGKNFNRGLACLKERVEAA